MLSPLYVSWACLLLFSKGQIQRLAEHLLFSLAKGSDACQLSGFSSELNSIFESSLAQELSVFRASNAFHKDKARDANAGRFRNKGYFFLFL